MKKDEKCTIGAGHITYNIFVFNRQQLKKAYFYGNEEGWEVYL